MDQTSHTHDDPPSDGGSRRSVVWTLAFLAVAVVALLAIQFFVPSRERETDGNGIGHPLPDLRVEPLTGDGRAVVLDNLAGKVVLLDFWGTWCGPCREELPHVAALAATFRDHSDFQLLAVSCGEGNDDPKSLRPNTVKFLRDNKLNIAAYFDPDSYTRREAEKVDGFYGAYPTTLVLDRQGVIRGMWVGYDSGDERRIGELIAKLLAEARSK